MTTRQGVTRRRAGVPAAVVGVLLVLAPLAGCGADRSPAPAAVASPPQAGAAVGAAATASRAAELEAGLTAVLVERVHLVATAARTGESEDRAAVDDSSGALADVLGATYRGAREPLLAALRACDRARLGDGTRAPSGDADRECGSRLTEVVRRVVPRLAAEQVDGRLGAAPEASVDGLRDAGAQARETAALLAGAVAEDRGLGATATPATRLRSDLTWLLVEHVALAGAAADAEPVAARTALGANSDALAALLGRSYPQARAPFATVWGRHLERLDDWSTALRTGRLTQAGLLRDGVLALPRELGPLLARHVDGLDSSRLAQELQPATASLVTAVEARARREAGAAARQQEAVADVPAWAALLAAAVAEDLLLA